MRDLMVLGSLFVFVPLALGNTFIAYLLWGWTAVIALNSYMYGFMQSVPYNMMFAIIAILFVCMGRDPRAGRITFPRTSVLFVLLAIQASVSATLAYDGLVRNMELYTNLLKALTFCIFMPWVLTQRYRIHAFVVVVALGLAFHGMLEGLKFLASGGGHKIQGLAKFGDNNHFAIVMIIGIPLLLYIYRYSTRRVTRLMAMGSVVLSAAAVIATHSRGGFVSLAAVALWIVFSSRRKWLGVALLVGGVMALVAMAPSSWSERMNTIKEADQDTSFMSRVVAWKISSAIALDRPLVGGGFHAVQAQHLWSHFRERNGMLGFVDTPYRPPVAFAAHSIYFEILGDLGFIGLFIFLAILINAFVTCRQIRRRAALVGARLRWAGDLASMLGAAMIGYVVGAAALSLAYLEVMYVLVMLIQVVWLFVDNPENRALARQAAHPHSSSGPSFSS